MSAILAYRRGLGPLPQRQVLVLHRISCFLMISGHKKSCTCVKGSSWSFFHDGLEKIKTAHVIITADTQCKAIYFLWVIDLTNAVPITTFLCET